MELGFYFLVQEQKKDIIIGGIGTGPT